MTRYGSVSIVKDEGDKIEAFLANVSQYAERIVLVDTGSSDGTLEKAFGMATPSDIIAYERSWVDFGHNRSQAFAYAHKENVDWLLALDADMSIEIDPDFVPDPEVDAYSVRIELGVGIIYYLPLLLNNKHQWQSVGPVHEYTALMDGTLGNRQKTDQVRIKTVIHERPGRLEGYLSLLEKEYAKDSTNPRTIFYLAQTHRDMGHRDEALKLFRERAGMGGWDQERFYAEYQAARLEPDQTVRWDSLIRAWESRPCRLEPLHDLLREMNAQSLHHTTWRLSRGPFTECTDIAFVHQWVWDYGIDFERSIAAWWTGNMETFESLTEKLLAQPNLPDKIRGQVVANAAMPGRKSCC